MASKDFCHLSERPDLHSPKQSELNTAIDFKKIYVSKEAQIFEDLESLIQGKVNISIKDTTSTISPLGLMAYGFCGLLINLSLIGLYPMDAMVLSISLCYGGLAQFLTGIYEWKKGNMLSSVICTSFGCFNFSSVVSYLLIKLELADAPSKISSGMNNLLWSILLFTIFIGNISAPYLVNFSLSASTFSFLLYAISDWNEDEKALKLAAVFGIIACVLAIYSAVAALINETFHKIVLPLGEKHLIKKRLNF